MFTKYKKVKGELKCPSPNKIMVVKHFSNSHKIKTGAYAGIAQFVQILDISNLRVTKATSGHFNKSSVLRKSFYYARQFMFFHILNLVKTFKRHRN